MCLRKQDFRSLRQESDPMESDPIMASLAEMLDELDPRERDMLEDFIVNFCDDSYLDDNGNPPNLFRMIIAEMV